jgi:Tol biopolymer transport system component
MTAPIYGPVPVTGPDAQPEIQSIAWAWDATALAMLRSDGSIAALVNLNDPFADNSQPLMLNTPDTAVADSGLTWAPSGDGVAYLAFNEAGYYSVFLSPRDEAPFPLLMSESGNPRSVAAFTWLPGRGRIAFVEDSPVPGSRTPSSIFTIFADGSGLELLVSAGRFAPAAMIGALNPSPDGRELAFIVYVPNDQGRPTFQSLWIMQIDTGDLRQVPIEPGYRVTDTWFTSEGLIWRGVDVGARVTGDGTTYTGIEPFILGRFDANGNTTLMFQSSLAEAE